MWLKKISDNEEVVTNTYDISNKNVCYLAALQHLGNIQKNNEQIT